MPYLHTGRRDTLKFLPYQKSYMFHGQILLDSMELKELFTFLFQMARLYVKESISTPSSIGHLSFDNSLSSFSSDVSNVPHNCLSQPWIKCFPSRTSHRRLPPCSKAHTEHPEYGCSYLDRCSALALWSPFKREHALLYFSLACPSLHYVQIWHFTLLRS